MNPEKIDDFGWLATPKFWSSGFGHPNDFALATPLHPTIGTSYKKLNFSRPSTALIVLELIKNNRYQVDKISSTFYELDEKLEGMW